MTAWQITALSMLGSAWAAQISDRNLLLPPASTVELSARPGCNFVWESERPEVASVGAVRCEDGVSDRRPLDARLGMGGTDL